MNKHISHSYRISTITFSNGITSHNRPCSTSHHHHATTLITCCHGRQNLPSQPFPSCPCHLYHPNPHPRQIRYKKRKLSKIWSRFFSFRSVVLLSPIFSTAKNALPRFLQRIGPVSIFYFNLGSMVQSSTDLSSMILSKTASGPDLWNSLACFFTDNQDYRAIQLTQFLQHCRQSYIFPKPPTHLLTNPFTFTD